MRGASMERIAAEAGVSRASLYCHFADKEDAFVQASQHLAGQMLGTVEFALASRSPVGEADPAGRIRQALLAVLEMVWRTTRTSTLGADWLESRDRLSGPIFAAAERQVIALLAQVLPEAGVVEAHPAAYVLLMGGKGIAYTATDLPTLHSSVTLLVDGLLRGLKRPS